MLQMRLAIFIWISSFNYNLAVEDIFFVNITGDKYSTGNFFFLQRNSSYTYHAYPSYLANQEFCQIKQEFEVFCSNVDIKNVSNVVPITTKFLTIFNSYLPALTKSYFSELKNLESLSLINNSHRYITSKAFKGLNKLKHLNLTLNNVRVFKHAFNFTSNLEKIDLTANNIMNLSMISKAVSVLKNLSELLLNHNIRIRKIYRDDFKPLQNSSLKTLELFNTTINYVEQYAFQHLHKLKKLDLSINYMNEETLMNVTIGLLDTEIEKLYLRLLVGMQDFPLEALIPLANTSIKLLDFGFNSIRKVPQFPYIPSLTSLWLPGCKIIGFEHDAFSNLPNLTDLILHNNEISHIQENVISIVNLEKLILDNQVISSIFGERLYLKDFCFKGARKLQVLSIRATDFGGIIRRHTFFGLENLEVLRLSKTKLALIQDYSFKTLNSLKKLDLFGNALKYLTNFTFYGLESLEILQLGYNAIYFVVETAPLQNCPLLHTLMLHKNKIKHIPEHTFQNMHNLTYLSLFENGIIPWKSPLFSTYINLTLLHLSKNQLTHVTTAMMKDFLKVTKYLDLTDNPFNCSSCGMPKFQKLLNESSLTPYSVDSMHDNRYICLDPPELRGHLLLHVNLTAYECLEASNFQYYTLILIIFFVTLTFIILITWASYSFRWYCRYFWFHCNATFKEKRSSSVESKNFAYDAFVSYNSNDTPWLISYLIPQLEEKAPKLKLCIHERDFEVGRLITENILEAIEMSRKVILILSEDFIRSEWCMLELHMAQHKLFDETRDVLLLVKLSYIERKLYTKNMLYLEKTRPCHTWTEDPVGQKLFWDKLRKHLCGNKHITESTEL